MQKPHSADWAVFWEHGIITAGIVNNQHCNRQCPAGVETVLYMKEYKSTKVQLNIKKTIAFERLNSQRYS